MKTIIGSGVVGLAMLVACGGGKPAQSGDTEGEGPSNVDGTRGDGRDVAGGETSEFSGGDLGLCPEIVSNTPLDLELDEVASWAALAAGHHELDMAWKREFLSDELSGFEEHTQLSLDVTVLAGRELVYGTGGYESYELEAACDGTMTQQLELEITFETADGALSGTFRHWVEPWGDTAAPSGLHLSTAQVRESNGDYDASSFTSTLELGLDPELGGTERLGVWLDFDREAARGYLTPYISLPPGAEDESATWYPLTGSFPDNGCSPHTRAVPLDAVHAALGTTPRAAYEASIPLEPTSITAAWEEPGPGGVRNGPVSLTWTEVTVTAGSPTHACESSDTVEVHAPLSVETADQLVRLTQPATFSFTGGGRYVSSHSPWIPTAGFEDATGMRVDFGASEYAAVELSHYRDADSTLEGHLTLHAWREFETEYIEHPALVWCAGAECDAMWCIISATDYAAECGIDE